MAHETENRLRDLCQQAVAAKDQSQVERLLIEFRLVLEDHVEQARVALSSQLSILNDMIQTTERPKETPDQQPAEKHTGQSA
ncbi:MAG: hypothetical protein ACREJM_00640 [Candidatus Saccharimonadales bacterium]